MRYAIFKFLTTILWLAASGTAFAHPGHDVSGFAAGLIHPFSGMDHLLAMVAVGLWAAQGGGQKVWQLPAAFIVMLAAGAVIATQWPSLPMVEAGIATSVLALGLVIALSLQLPALYSVAITTLFGLLHGYAHGLELPQSVAPAVYALGFLAATAILHLVGITMGVVMRRRYKLLTRFLGGTIAISGAYMLVIS